MIDIKPVDNAEQDRLIGLILPIQQQEFKLDIGIEDQPDLLDISAHYLSGGGTFLAAYSGTELIGCIALIRASDSVGALRKMFVRQDFRGKEQGVAQQLLDRLLLYARKTGLSSIYLGTVEPLKAAHRFYERNGFQRIERVDLPPEFPIAKKDSLFFGLRLKKKSL